MKKNNSEKTCFIVSIIQVGLKGWQRVKEVEKKASIPLDRLQQSVNRELSGVQAEFRKGRGTRDQIVNICWIIEKARVPEKHLLLIY